MSARQCRAGRRPAALRRQRSAASSAAAPVAAALTDGALTDGALADPALADLIIDLANVRYCDLAGLRAIVRLTLADNRGPDHGGRRVTVHDMPEHLSNILRILGWDATPGLVLAER